MSIMLPRIAKNCLKDGYTLIELLIVISIIALVFGVGTASYRNYQGRQLFEASVREILSDLRLAQEYALAGRSEGCSQFEGYVFESAQNGLNYSIYRRCGGNNVLYKNKSLPSGTTIQVRGNNNGDRNFRFNALGKGLDVTTAEACVTITRGLYTKYVKIDKVSGNIEVTTNPC
jgi:prepilin-type N-terminal cleavage/methylation domain-containing protein